MRIATACAATLLAFALVGAASATPVKNGDFSNVSGTTDTHGQAGTYGTRIVSVDDWNVRGYAIWYPDAGDATTSNGNGGALYSTVTAPPGGGAFIGLNGDPVSTLRASIEQAIHGFTYGQDYWVSFDWGATQLLGKSGDTTEQLRVSLFGKYLYTDKLSMTSGAFSGWHHERFRFTPNTTAAGFLQFLSLGSPSGLPPMALLANVEMTPVPEPSELTLFGLGLLALGGLVLAARRRELRRCRTTD